MSSKQGCGHRQLYATPSTPQCGVAVDGICRHLPPPFTLSLSLPKRGGVNWKHTKWSPGPSSDDPKVGVRRDDGIAHTHTHTHLVGIGETRARHGSTGADGPRLFYIREAAARNSLSLLSLSLSLFSHSLGGLLLLKPCGAGKRGGHRRSGGWQTRPRPSSGKPSSAQLPTSRCLFLSFVPPPLPAE